MKGLEGKGKKEKAEEQKGAPRGNILNFNVYMKKKTLEVNPRVLIGSFLVKIFKAAKQTTV